MTGPVLRVEGVDRTFGRGRGAVAAVRDVTFDVHPAEHVALVGPSGAGKSTIAQLVCGMISPSRGTISLEGEPCAADAVPPWDRRARRRLGQRRHLIFQDAYEALPTRWTVGRVVAEPLEIQRIGSPDGRRALVAGALDDVGLSADDFADRPVAELSGGERQRVALARGLVTGPALLVADEPTAMLDAALREDLLGLLARLAHDRGMAVLHVTHDLGLAARWADRILVMDDGRLVEAGRADDVLGSPSAPVTRALLAASRRLRGRAPSDGGHDPR